MTVLEAFSMFQVCVCVLKQQMDSLIRGSTTTRNMRNMLDKCENTFSAMLLIYWGNSVTKFQLKEDTEIGEKP